jgi:hypothetical protein
MIVFQAPYSLPIVTVTLPNPVLGDSYSQSLKTRFGFAMSGRIVTTISTQLEKKIQYGFVNLRRTHVDALLSLLASYASADWKLTDYNSDIWKVKCISNPIEFTENKHFYECKLDLQGTPV